MFNILAQVETANAVNWPLEISKIIAPGILVLLGLWIWHLKKRSEPRYESLGYLNRKRLDGLLKAFSLLAYITEVENPKAVMQWEKNGSQTVCYLRPDQAREYIVALAELFYADGYGLLLGRNIKELFYEYRGHLYGVLLKTKDEHSDDERIKLENKELIKRMKEIYDELNAELRQEMEKIKEDRQ
jgi:hypothetical protein